ncbi:MAG: cleavage and polyadenylation specificity factor subunit 2, partial [Paramarteilia canceri]
PDTAVCSLRNFNETNYSDKTPSKYKINSFCLKSSIFIGLPKLSELKTSLSKNNLNGEFVSGSLVVQKFACIKKKEAHSYVLEGVLCP